MLNAWKLAAAAALGGLAGHQEEAPVVQVQTPKPAVEVTAQPVVYDLAVQVGQRVSVSFNQATIGEVFEWFTKNGVSFVAAEAEVDRSQKVTLNIQNQPLTDVVDAIAAALGGHWENRGEVRVFRKGLGMTTFFGPEGIAHEAFRVRAPQGVTSPTRSLRGLPSKEALLPKLEIERMNATKEAMKIDKKALEKALQEHAKGVKEHKLSEKEHEQIRIEVEKAMKDVDKAMAEVNKELQGKIVSPDGKVWMTRPEGADKAMAEAFKKLETARIYGSDGKARVFATPKVGDVNVYGLRRHEGLLAPSATAIRIEGESIKKLMNSLTMEQRDLHNRQGHLKARDLTIAQRKMIGIGEMKGDWSVTYKIDGRTITVKGN